MSDQQFSDMLEQVVLQTVFKKVNTSLIGTITKVIRGDVIKVNVKPTIGKIVNGQNQYYKELTDVPLIMPVLNGFIIEYPVDAFIGTDVVVFFIQRSIDGYMSTGEIQPQRINRKFDLSDAVAIPGLVNFAKGNSNISADGNFKIQYDNQKITIKKNGDIDIGSSGLRALLTDSVISKFNSHVHTGVTTGPGSSGPPGTPWSSADATQKVQAQ